MNNIDDIYYKKKYLKYKIKYLDLKSNKFYIKFFSYHCIVFF